MPENNVHDTAGSATTRRRSGGTISRIFEETLTILNDDPGLLYDQREDGFGSSPMANPHRSNWIDRTDEQLLWA